MSELVNQQGTESVADNYKVSDIEFKSPVIVGTTDESTITTSAQLADYLSKGKSITKDIEAVATTQSDMKSYLSLYARSQLQRIEKLTEYLNIMEDKMMQDINSYDPDQFMNAMRLLQTSLSSALDLLKMVGTDEKYLNILYHETNNFINQGSSSQVNVSLPRESRDKLRTILSSMTTKNEVININ